MTTDPADPKFDAKEVFDKYCMDDRIFLMKMPVNCFSISHFQKWIEGTYLDGDKDNVGDTRMAKLIVKIWIKLGLIKIGRKGADTTGPFDWYKLIKEKK